MGGRGTKSGKFFYYRCVNAAKRGPKECLGYWFRKSEIESFAADKIRNYILTKENLLELVRLTTEELDIEMGVEKHELGLLNRQIEDMELRLEYLYDTLETGSFSSGNRAI